MSLIRTIVRAFQRTDAIDVIRTNDAAQANLELALRHFLVPQPPGLLRGGTVTADSGMFVEVAAFAGITSTGRAAILETPGVAGPFAANNSANSRIDLLSAYVVDSEISVEGRTFLNPGVTPATQYTQDVPTRLESTVALRITAGTPAANPVAPAVPAGDIPLAEVTIAPGTTQISNGNIVQRFEARMAPQRVQKTADSSGTISLPWESDRLRAVLTPAGSTTVFEGQVEFNPYGINQDTVLVLEVVDKTNANAVVAKASYGIGNFAEANSLTTYTVRGSVTGPRAAADFVLRMRLSNNAASTSLSFARNVILIARTQ